MNKSILMSIRPQWLCKILNGEKTIEIRKKFPKDYVGWVFIYVTKGDDNNRLCRDEHYGKKFYLCGPITYNFESLNGKVVGRFWCDKVEEIKEYASQNAYDEWYSEYDTRNLTAIELRKKSCLTYEELNKYLGYKIGYAIHISKLEVFDKPKELKDYKTAKTYDFKDLHNCHCCLTKAPMSWCYIEGD